MGDVCFFGAVISGKNHPRPKLLEEVYAQDGAHPRIQRLLRQYEDSLGIPFWDCPLALPFAYYQDFGHMNARGRNHFNPWLLDRIHQHMIQN